MRWLSFTFRDLFWLILLVASVVPWIIEHKRLAKEIERYRAQSPYLAALSAQNANSLVRATTRQREALGSLSDEELDERLRLMLMSGNAANPNFEPCLAEMVNRRMASSLAEHYGAFNRGQFGFRIRGQQRDLLTALRRAEGKPDPLRIRLGFDRLTAKRRDESVPQVQAEFENVDADREPIWRGPGYGTESHLQWKFVLTDNQGRQAPPAKHPDPWSTPIGRFRMSPLQFQEKESRYLDLRQHFAPPSSGKYQLQAFHREAGIPRDSDWSGLFITRSEPISVVVHNPNERGSKPSAADVRAAFAAVVACGMLAFFGISLRERVRNWVRFFTIRDAIWFVIVVAVLAVAWFDHARQVDELWSVLPDSEAMWSIELADSPD